MTETAETASDFIRDIIDADIRADKNGGRVITRFPPEPNGCLHIGHAKSICLNFGVAADYKGCCHLRMDDTNPAKEEVEYVDSIKQDVRWLGFDWGKHLHYASDYFGKLYDYAVELIRKGKAYACALGTEEFKGYRGSPDKPGKESPWRNRSPEESLELFRRMRAGEFEEGAYVIRAKIDMNSPNAHMRDPVIFRIKKAEHHRTGGAWVVYPMYDFAHCLSDSIEGITHSICTLEFEVHRPLYDWILNELGARHPQQIEFSRLNLTYTVMSKRKLIELVKDGRVSGWDDPRLPTISGLRRRGYTPASIREFARRVGVTKFEGFTDIALLEHCIRDELNKTAPRVMVVQRPLKVVLENYPAGQVEEMECVNNPEDQSMGVRKVPFSRELYIERDDFEENPRKDFFRLAPGREARLRYGYIVKCVSAPKDPQTGEISELRCVYNPATRGGNVPDGRKVKGAIHWVSAAHAVDVQIRLYDRLFTVERPEENEAVDFKTHLNPCSLEVLMGKAEPLMGQAKAGSRYQFERKGYFFADPVESVSGAPVFNLIVTLKDTWAKIAKRGG
ncbi:MAG: glutamine--tRNA ligase/YqeY domain fusion protein [Verrucomicrobiota bacterium]|nr:glutamine--tRNA ligase/YqeY domain fusion protein [Verrucomicrobiota bacterium]